MQLLIWIVGCCLFPFLMTALGAATVFLCPGGLRETARRGFLGFAAGVMLAASFWSLLHPAIASAEALGLPGWLPAAVGVIGGVLFLLCADLCVSRGNRCREDAQNRASAAICGDASDGGSLATNVVKEKGGQIKPRRGGGFLLQLAMTTHNIPEGMAVGLSAALAAKVLAAEATLSGGIPFSALFGAGGGTEGGAALLGAIALSLGIGLQNFPEGAAVSLPLQQEGMDRPRAFLRGCLSGAVEPVFGILTALVLSEAHAVMPWLLSFAAGAMLYVVVCELIPAANGRPEGDGTPHRLPLIGTLCTVAGFLVMMVLDVALG